jgi:hypothetical protein
MASSLVFLLFFCLHLFSSSTEAQDDDRSLPANVEVDLIFPRNDTYKPIFPFPIVFVIRGGRATLEHGLHVWWSAEYASRTLYTTAPSSGYLSGKDDQIYGSTEPIYYLIQESQAVVNSTFPHWRLDWGVTINQNCTFAESQAGVDARISQSVQG